MFFQFSWLKNLKIPVWHVSNILARRNLVHSSTNLKLLANNLRIKTDFYGNIFNFYSSKHWRRHCFSVGSQNTFKRRVFDRIIGHLPTSLWTNEIYIRWWKRLKSMYILRTTYWFLSDNTVNDLTWCLHPRHNKSSWSTLIIVRKKKEIEFICFDNVETKKRINPTCQYALNKRQLVRVVIVSQHLLPTTNLWKQNLTTCREKKLEIKQLYSIAYRDTNEIDVNQIHQRNDVRAHQQTYLFIFDKNKYN